MQTFNHNGAILSIKKRVTENSCIISYKNDHYGILVEDVEAAICKVTGKSGLYLRFKAEDQYIMLKICEGFSEQSRKIADYIWENIQDRNALSMSYGYTTEFWANWAN